VLFLLIGKGDDGWQSLAGIKGEIIPLNFLNNDRLIYIQDVNVMGGSIKLRRFNNVPRYYQYCVCIYVRVEKCNHWHDKRSRNNICTP
jgi:hypothetical protein